MVETSPQMDSVTSKSHECFNNKRARGSGKLSSRNTRRKRRDNRKNSAKKLKPPIPSFSCSPIIEDEEEVENEALIASEKVANESNKAHATTEKIEIQAELNNDGVPTESTDIKVAAVDVVSGINALNNCNMLQKEDKSRSISTSSVEAESDDIVENNDLDNSVQNAMEDMLPSHAAESTSLCYISRQEHNKILSPCATTPIVHDHASTRKTNEKPRKNINGKDTKDSKNLNDVLRVAEPITQRPETIELLDDDNDELSGKDVPLFVSRSNAKNNGEREKDPTKPKFQPRKRKRTEKDLISVDSSSDDESVTIAKKTKPIAQKKKPARRKEVATKKRSSSKIKEDESGGCIQKHTNKGRCTVCASCKCQAGNESATIPQKLPTVSLSGSDARVEQTLKNRLLKIERSIALSESQRHECARELKRHRSTVQKKSSKKGANKGERQHFLADAQVTEEMAQAFATTRVDRKDAKQAKARVFGKRPSKLNSEPQPTLTQMFGCGGGEKDEDRSDDEMQVDKDAQSCSGDISSEDENSRSDPHDSISFWNDDSINTTHQFMGSMIQYDDATTRFKDKQMNNTSTWAKAASKIMKNKTPSQSSEEEEGIVALVELFDISPKKKSVSLPQDEDCNDDHLLQSQLSQCGALAAQNIKEEIAKDETKREAIERVCKNWQENVDYSFKRKDAKGLESALTQVKEERQRMFDMRDKILQAFLERSSTLDVYEKAIEGSLKRLAEKENNT